MTTVLSDTKKTSFRSRIYSHGEPMGHGFMATHASLCREVVISGSETFEVVPSIPLVEHMASELKQLPVILNSIQRKLVDEAVRETCDYRSYILRAANIRSNHSHVVASAFIKPEKIVMT